MPRPNVTHYAVLGLLSLGPRSGYDLRQFVDRAMGHFWHESYRWLYRTLEMQKARGLTSARDEEYGERQRTVYRITPKGQRALRRWLAEPPAVTPPRDELLLKLLLGEAAPPRAIAAHLRRHLDLLRERKANLAAAVKALPGLDLDAATRRHLALTLDRSRRINAAELRWAENALKKRA